MWGFRDLTVLCSIFFLLVGVVLGSMTYPAEGFKTEITFFFQPIHQEITEEAMGLYLDPEVLNEIVDEHGYMEITHPLRDWHFDGCEFEGTVQNINERYLRIVSSFNPDNPVPLDAANAFGQLLHPVQDFYSHSNWVETKLGGRITSDLVEDGYGLWFGGSLQPYSKINSEIFVIQGEVVPEGYDVKRIGKIIIVNNTKGEKLPGLISGSFGPDDCPDEINLSHDRLNKDNPSEIGHSTARELAIAQTHHEFCRLTSLIDGAYGKRGLDVLFLSWVSAGDFAVFVCPNLEGYIPPGYREVCFLDDRICCPIANAVLGTDLSDVVQSLREFRDNEFLETEIGNSFMNLFYAGYYAAAPYVSDHEENNEWFKDVVRLGVYPMMSIFKTSEIAFSFLGGEIGSLIALVISSSMLGFVYFSPFALSVTTVRKTKFNYKIASLLIIVMLTFLGTSYLSDNSQILGISMMLVVLTVLSISAILSVKLLQKFFYFLKSQSDLAKLEWNLEKITCLVTRKD